MKYLLNLDIFIAENVLENVVSTIAAILFDLNVLTHFGPVTPHGNIDLGHWPR